VGEASGGDDKKVTETRGGQSPAPSAGSQGFKAAAMHRKALLGELGAKGTHKRRKVANQSKTGDQACVEKEETEETEERKGEREGERKRKKERERRERERKGKRERERERERDRGVCVCVYVNVWCVYYECVKVLRCDGVGLIFMNNPFPFFLPSIGDLGGF
jgi:hypothetical protein